MPRDHRISMWESSQDFVFNIKNDCRNQFPILDKLFDKSPAFSDYKYQVNRDECQTFNIKEFQSLMRDKDNKICIYGLPKSGNNWLMNLITDALGIGSRDVFFTHGSSVHKQYFNPNIIRTCYLLRDMRDIVVSLYKFSSTKGMRDDTCVFNDIESFYYEYFLNYVHSDLFGCWEMHIEKVVKWGVPIIRYESLWDSPEVELERLFQRWHLSVPSEMIVKSVNKNNIDNYKKGNVDLTSEHLHPTHFRKGGHGNYREELPEKILMDIEKRFGNYLQRWGYHLKSSIE